MTNLAVNYPDVIQAAATIAGVAHKTPVLTSRTVNELVQGEVFFKAENFQRTGSFKFRGAYNALASLDRAAADRGVIAFSSGNHAQGVALAGKILGISTTIVMPENAPAVKLEATCGYGAEVIAFHPAETKREELARQLVKERGLTLIPPFDYAPTIAGQGTTGLELLQEVGELDLLLVCCGGGGLLSGCAIAAHHLSPQCQIIGVEPAAGDDGRRSFYAKTLQSVEHPDTIADGARTSSLGNLTFPLILEYVADMVTVTDAELRETMFFLWERLKLVVEPTGALAASALLHQKIPTANKRIGVIISGGNINLGSYFKV
jgi:threonine dehydratase